MQIVLFNIIFLQMFELYKYWSYEASCTGHDLDSSSSGHTSSGENCLSNQQVVVGDLKPAMLNHEFKELLEHLYGSHITMLESDSAVFVNKNCFSFIVYSFFPMPWC
jgi:hypothetical protein